MESGLPNVLAKQVSTAWRGRLKSEPPALPRTKSQCRDALRKNRRYPALCYRGGMVDFRSKQTGARGHSRRVLSSLVPLSVRLPDMCSEKKEKRGTPRKTPGASSRRHGDVPISLTAKFPGYHGPPKQSVGDALLGH
jgi:hypothetical protein